MRVLTFLSDFGSRSPYPAAMKGAAAAYCDAAFVDLSHDVSPLDVREGAYLLWSAAPAFPAGTVHCAVVDPGVGTARAALAVASGGQTLVGPDNGLLMPAARRLGSPTVFRLAAPAYWRAPVSPTFHGRDIFAPAAAHLAAGAPIEALGLPAEAYVDLVFPTGRRDGRCLRGEVLWVDAFGNLITTIPGDLLGGLAAARRLVVDAGAATLEASVARTFGDVARGQAAVLVGSDGVLEVALNGESLAARTGAGPGAPVRISPA